MRRIGALQSQLRPGGTPAAAAEQRDVAEAAAESMNLLSDAQVKEFITEGFLALPITELGSDFHKNLYGKSKDAFARLAEEQRDPRPYAGRRPPGSARALRNKCPVHSPAVFRRRLLQVGHRWRARREEHIEVFARDFQTCVATTELGG